MATLQALKTQAAELGLTPDDVRKHGDLRCTATWQAAVDAAVVVQPEPEPELLINEVVRYNDGTESGLLSVVLGFTRGGRVFIKPFALPMFLVRRSDLLPRTIGKKRNGGRSPPLVS